MFKRIKFLLLRLFLSSLDMLIRLYSLTFRMTVENEEVWMAHLRGGGRVLLCNWHQQFFAAIRPFKRYATYNPALMISKSRDGDLIAAVAEKRGWYPVRGSTSKGGGTALHHMVERLRRTGLAAHVVDGPRGPAGKVQPGLILLAQRADAVIVPFCVTASRAWHLKSWDRFLLPRPFARVTLHFQQPIRLEPAETREALEEQRQQMESMMLPFLQP
jgi:lysophospholipid acyltransferase (LPLAT)-like uncharacterized protein